jgi:hypothetical protein
MIHAVRVVSRKLVVALMLTLCIGLQLLEGSGRWDRTIKDSNDEAGIVAIVLCTGIAILAARILLERIRASRRVSLLKFFSSTPVICLVRQFVVPNSCDSPPLPLRI